MLRFLSWVKNLLFSLGPMAEWKDLAKDSYPLWFIEFVIVYPRRPFCTDTTKLTGNGRIKFVT